MVWNFVWINRIGNMVCIYHGDTLSIIVFIINQNLTQLCLSVYWLLLSYYLLCWQVCALKVTEGARRRILKAGGSVMTFDQLAMSSPKGKGTVLLSGQHILISICTFFFPLFFLLTFDIPNLFLAHPDCNQIRANLDSKNTNRFH